MDDQAMNYKKYVPKTEETVNIILVVVVAYAIDIIAGGIKYMVKIKSKVTSMGHWMRTMVAEGESIGDSDSSKNVKMPRPNRISAIWLPFV